ncbi:MAG TPA: biopolymer transporter TolR [Solibacterales bacterium]|nr:biopolymer transporter TolR [Bryobacterales bacterium]
MLLLQVAAAAIGLFDVNTDIGANPKPGAASHDATRMEYRITGGGANIWGAVDAFRFLARRLTGDFALTANVRFEGAGVDPHRKAVLMVRQDLTPGAAYADIALHGDGLTALQYRAAAGGLTEELRSPLKAPERLRIERRGNRITVFAGGTATGPITLDLRDPVYVGLGVSSHNAEVTETAVFSDVRLENQPAPAPAQPRFRSKITIFDVAARQSKVIFTGDGVIEAPNWSRDGQYLLVNTNGNLYRVPLAGPALQQVELEGGTYRCNNDHDLTRDGKLLAFSASTPQSRQSQVFTATADGKNVKLITPKAPSYFHGWSPDARHLLFVGLRNGKYEIYRAPATGDGTEEQLTSAGAYDDGPEYSPDGKWIYFNSDRGGAWNVWRMPAAGAGPGDKLAQQVTNDPLEDWFPHLSPDGKTMVFLSFPAGTKGHNDRMPGVQLRLRAAPRGGTVKEAPVTTLATIYGGQGTINVNSWSPDSRRFAFVVYEPVP